MQELAVTTERRVVLVDITTGLQELARKSGVSDGVLVACVPHTTAGITVNENADPSVRSDLEMTWKRLVPSTLPFTHLEGNADAHARASLVGHSVTLPVVAGRLVLGTWQGVFFAEFDGPRRRRVLVSVLVAS